ncbi:MAG: hypothetical protein ABI824_18075 [Acidobacteriota bacterium]
MRTARLPIDSSPASLKKADLVASADFYEGARQGLEEAKHGEGLDIDEFFAAFEAKHGLSR